VSVGPAAADVAELAGVAEGEFAGLVDAVDAAAPVVPCLAQGPVLPRVLGRRPGVGGAGEQVAGMVIEEVRISMSVPSARAQWVKPDCQVSLGWSASRRCREDFGRFFGSGMTSPAVCRIRRIVEVYGGRCPSRSRCQAMVTGPRPTRQSAVPCRRVRMRALTVSLVLRGLLGGRLERASTAVMPPVASRRRRSWTQRRLNP
jgi:hypothetical protein